MTDLLHILPSFPPRLYGHLLPSLEKSMITTTDLMTLDALEIAKRAHLPVLDVRNLANAIDASLKAAMGVASIDGVSAPDVSHRKTHCLRGNGKSLLETWSAISTLDDELDSALGGGVPAGYITEITGESGAGKTQFLLTLLLSVQLAPPRGLGRTAVYISTEAALSTDRLSQLLAHHPRLTGLDASERPSLDGVRSITVPDIESQDHILQYQLPVSVRRHGVGLVVIDSVAANYRAEFDRRRGESVSMARRANDLMRLGALLRDVARIENVAVVVANQVADRISSDDPVVAAAAAAAAAGATGGMGMGWSTPESSLSLKENMQPGAGQDQVFPADVLGLDHQQRWFTGWGDEQQAPDKAGFGMSPIAAEHLQNLKTPSLGHAWTLQLSARIALVKEERRQAHPSTSVARADAEAGAEAETVQRNETAQWRRRLKVVFCPWARSHAGGRDDGVEFVVGREGIKSVRPVTAAARDEDLPRYSLPTRLNSSPCPSSRSSRLSSSSSSPSSPSPSPPSPRPPRPPSPSPRPAAPAENEAEQREDDDDMQEAEI